MSSSKNPSNSANQDDPWEQLAEDLFGLEYGKEHAAHESPSPAVEPVSSAQYAAAPPAPELERSRDDFVAAAPPPAEEPPRFAAERTFESPPVFAETAETEEPDAGDVVGSAPEVVEPTAAEPPRTEPASPQDSYWDALANWNWDESEGSKGKPRSEPSRHEQPRSPAGAPPRGGSRGGRDEGRGRRGSDRPSRQESTAPAASAPVSMPPAPRQAPPSASDDFGLGLESQPSAPSPATAGSAAERRDVPAGNRDIKRPGERGPETGEGGEAPRKRRRRRRRRGGRGGEGAPGAATPAAAAAVPGTDWDDSAGPEADLPDDEFEIEDEASVESASEEEVKPAATDEADEGPPSRGRRHGRRSEESHRRSDSNRGARRFDEEESQEIIDVGGGLPETEQVADGDEDDEAGEQAVSYEDVPTWEEAISYLLHPNQVQVDPEVGSSAANPPRGAAPTDQTRQTRHVGHRKHRR